MNTPNTAGFIDTVKQANALATVAARSRKALGTAGTMIAKPAKKALGTARTMAAKPGARTAKDVKSVVGKAPNVAKRTAEQAAKPGILGAIGSRVARGVDRVTKGRGTKLVNRLGERNLARGAGASAGGKALRQIGGATVAGTGLLAAGAAAEHG